MAGILKVDQVQSDSNLAFAIAGSNVAFMNATSLQMVGSNVSLAGTNVITNGRVVPTAQASGAILQVVTATNNGVTTGSGNETYGLLGLNATITPYFSTSRIIIVGHIQGQASTNRCWGQIRRSIAGGTATVITNYFDGGNANRYYHFGDFYSNSVNDLAKLNSATWVDLPATTSSIQYKFYMSVDSSGTWYNNSTASLTGSGSVAMGSSCMIMEVAI